MSKRLKIQLRRLLTIIVAWLSVGVLITLYDWFLLQSHLSSGPAAEYDFITNFTFNVAAALMGSVFGGIFLVFFVNERLKNRPYGYTLLAVGAAFAAIVAFITFFLGLFFTKLLSGYWPFQNDIGTEQFISYVFNTVHIKNLIVWGIVTLFTQFFLQVNDKFGPGQLWTFIKGKYQIPQSETRIFMFLDITGSTTIAEKLGNKKYYSLLRDFYADITNDIVFNEGMIYQYVGDEVVVSWNYTQGVQEASCLKCYFDIREHMEGLRDKYEAKYGLVPDFKAAIHFGSVTAGEIGVVKRDITYSGDVLNTTARLLSKCHHYSSQLLVSGKLQEVLADVSGGYKFQKVGEEILRGKTMMVEVYDVEQAGIVTG